MTYTINPSDYKEAITKGEDCYIQFSRINTGVEPELRKIIRRYMQKYDILYLNEIVVAIIKELVNNAIKANIKRLYFKLKSLDITKEEEYRLGMQHFKEDVFQSNPDKFFSLLEKSNLIVRVSFKIMKDYIRINIINNMTILDLELKKIEARVNKAYQCDDISEVFDDVLDDSEGAGLGLIMALTLFKNIGLGKKFFKIENRDKLTVATVLVPQKIVARETHTEITDKLLKEIDQLPTFPQNILEIQRLCLDPESTIKTIAERIKLDPGLTANILKLANSAGYITANKVENIEDAVKIVGLKGISTLIIASGVKNILGARYKKLEEIWIQSTKAAFYAQKIAIQVNRNKLSDNVYLAAILSDIGKIILNSINPDLEKRLLEIVSTKGILASQLIEEVSIGMSHGTLGGKILRKWKFSEALINTIEFHHRPYLAPEKYTELVYIIYLAHSLLDVEDRHGNYENIDEDVLNYFNLNDRKNIEMLHNILFETYKKKMEIG